MKFRALLLCILLFLQAAFLYEQHQRLVLVRQMDDRLKPKVSVFDPITAEIEDEIKKSKSEVDAANCARIHAPMSGCPAGYKPETEPYFIERDGSRRFACVSDDPKKQDCTDFLLPGEGFSMHIVIPNPMPGSPENGLDDVPKGPRT